ncbi:uncharacterized protein LOC106091023 [Stomoxys calcitrans]|uniref:Uncharacterized protein n=1 Tax=Stomoxys calcitrans TaxID=35570 RepID=A0A1I8Q718_STOCA|nr:uncharacterized protein LOC106091023 [Stomoxys calcitrans]
MNFCPSRKELLAFAQIGLAILALWNYFEINLFDIPMYDLRLFEHQCVNVAICFASLYYGLGTWLWYSRGSITRTLMRLHSMLVHTTLIILLFVTRSRYLIAYGPFIRGVFTHEIFTDEDERIAFSLILMQCMLLLTGIVVVVQANSFITSIVGMWAKRNRHE